MKTNKEFDPENFTLESFMVDGKIPDDLIKGATNLANDLVTGKSKLNTIFDAASYARFNKIDCYPILVEKEDAAFKLVHQMIEDHVKSGGKIFEDVPTVDDNIVSKTIAAIFKNQNAHHLIKEFMELDKFKYLLADTASVN